MKDRLTIWAILRLNVKLPDLQQTPSPRPGTIYYYYGRWLKLVRHHSESRIVEKMATDARVEYVCQGCALYRLGLPCKKVYQGNVDLCFTHYYKLIKGKGNEKA